MELGLNQCLSAFILLLSLINNPSQADTRRCNVNSDGCTCPQGTFLFDGDCHTPKNYGQECYSVHQCLRGTNTFGDPFIACLNQTCACRPGTKYMEGRCKNLTFSILITTSNHSVIKLTTAIVPLSTLHFMTTLPLTENTLTSDTKNNASNINESSVSTIVIGSIAFILLSILIITCCFCFCFLGRCILVSIYSEPAISIPDDHSIPTHHKFNDDIFDDLEIGRDNPCFLVDKRKNIDVGSNDDDVSENNPELVKISIEERNHLAPNGDATSIDPEDQAFKSNENLRYIDDITDDAANMSTKNSRCHSSSSEGEII
nr:uncharacterized protein LOC121119225 isoform X1 [Lepeophtheirus salmonis]